MIYRPVFRKPSAVSVIPPKVFALCQEDYGECDWTVSPETRREFSATLALNIAHRGLPTACYTFYLFMKFQTPANWTDIWNRCV